MKRTLVFQGDSITDASRKQDEPSHLGQGYVSMIAVTLGQRYPDLECVNRGISGNRTLDLLRRWDKDFISLQPDFFSLYIGINNTWRRYDKKDPTSPEVFAEELTQILERSFNETSASAEKSILMEPFVLDEPAGSKSTWREEDLNAKQEIVREAAKKYGCRHLPLQSIFDQALQRKPAAFWAADGVHPSPAGHYLIAEEWLKMMAPVLDA